MAHPAQGASAPLYVPCPLDSSSLKLESVAAILDLIYTLCTTGDVESLCEHSLAVSIGNAMDLVNETRDLLLLLAAPSQGGAA